MRILFIITSHDRLLTGDPTGYWYEELAAPYYRFVDAGFEVTLSSPAGGQPPMDPMSYEPQYQTDATRRFDADAQAGSMLSETVALSDVSADGYDAVFYPGGHGPMFDLAEDRTSIALIERFWNSGKTVSSTCHGPVVLRHAMTLDGEPLVRGRRVTGFTNGEEADVDRVDAVPFLLEDELKRLGADYRKGADWEVHTEIDGRLITGQNPQSAGPVADAVISQLNA